MHICIGAACCRPTRIVCPALRPVSLTANSLKLIAVLAMVMQHIAIFFLSPGAVGYSFLHEAGRITAPIMCFFVAEGFHYTSNLKKYLLRLFLGALLSHLPYALAFGNDPLAFWRATSILWSLFLGLAALAVCKRTRLSLALKIAFVALCCLLSYPGNFNCVAVLWILAFGLLRDRPLWKWLSFAAVAGLYVLEYWVIDSSGSPWQRLFTLLAVPLLLLYGNRHGRKSKLLQWGYYLFYPAHLLALYAIGLLGA